ncbi:MAG: hypothetical protein Q9196_001653 [Gyalolechia fulgens]
MAYSTILSSNWQKSDNTLETYCTTLVQKQLDIIDTCSQEVVAAFDLFRTNKPRAFTPWTQRIKSTYGEEHIADLMKYGEKLNAELQPSMQTTRNNWSGNTVYDLLEPACYQQPLSKKVVEGYAMLSGTTSFRDARGKAKATLKGSTNSVCDGNVARGVNSILEEVLDGTRSSAPPKAPAPGRPKRKASPSLGEDGTPPAVLDKDSTSAPPKGPAPRGHKRKASPHATKRDPSSGKDGTPPAVLDKDSTASPERGRHGEPDKPKGKSTLSEGSGRKTSAEMASGDRNPTARLIMPPVGTGRQGEAGYSSNTAAEYRTSLLSGEMLKDDVMMHVANCILPVGYWLVDTCVVANQSRNEASDREKRKFQNCNFTVLLIHHRSAQHWSLAVYRRRIEVIQYYDSVNEDYLETASRKLSMETLQRFGEETAKIYWERIVRAFHVFAVENAANYEQRCPLQSDNINCGLHVLFNLDSFINCKEGVQDGIDYPAVREYFGERLDRRIGNCYSAEDVEQKYPALAPFDLPDGSDLNDYEKLARTHLQVLETETEKYRASVINTLEQIRAAEAQRSELQEGQDAKVEWELTQKWITTCSCRASLPERFRRRLQELNDKGLERSNTHFEEKRRAWQASQSGREAMYQLLKGEDENWRGFFQGSEAQRDVIKKSIS